MIRVALNKSWRDHPTMKDLRGNTPRLSTTIRDDVSHVVTCSTRDVYCHVTLRAIVIKRV